MNIFPHEVINISWKHIPFEVFVAWMFTESASVPKWRQKHRAYKSHANDDMKILKQTYEREIKFSQRKW